MAGRKRNYINKRGVTIKATPKQIINWTKRSEATLTKKPDNKRAKYETKIRNKVMPAYEKIVQREKEKQVTAKELAAAEELALPKETSGKPAPEPVEGEGIVVEGLVSLFVDYDNNASRANNNFFCEFKFSTEFRRREDYNTEKLLNAVENELRKVLSVDFSPILADAVKIGHSGIDEKSEKPAGQINEDKFYGELWYGYYSADQKKMKKWGDYILPLNALDY
jgi:hypothetical protein